MQIVLELRPPPPRWCCCCRSSSLPKQVLLRTVVVFKNSGIRELGHCACLLAGLSLLTSCANRARLSFSRSLSLQLLHIANSHKRRKRMERATHIVQVGSENTTTILLILDKPISDRELKIFVIFKATFLEENIQTTSRSNNVKRNKLSSQDTPFLVMFIY